MSYANLLLNILYHIVIEMNIRESCLQTGTFIYKPGISVTKQDFHLQTGIIGLQMGFSGYYLPDRKAWMPFCVLIGLKKKRWCVIIYPKSVVFNNASEVVEMLKNNIEVDVKVKCIEAGKTQTQLAETIGTTGQYVNRIIKKGDGVMNKTFVQMLDALGYDIELHYVKKEEV